MLTVGQRVGRDGRVLFKRRTVKFASAWSAIFTPLLFLAAGLAIPYGFVANYVMKRRERQFRRDMERLGRTMLWPDFVRKSSEKNGTLIVAVDSHKGPVRWWWTSENLAGLSIDSAKVRCSDLFGKVEEAVLIVGKRDKAEAIAVRRKLRWIELGPQRRYGARTKRHVLTSGQSVPGFAVPSE
ncbi:MAG: hypothetical protein JOZ83_17595 [Silvibacterium sp.]|nr:hypothetical protein [Silvibacterium sp.]